MKARSINMCRFRQLIRKANEWELHLHLPTHVCEATQLNITNKGRVQKRDFSQLLYSRYGTKCNAIHTDVVLKTEEKTNSGCSWSQAVTE